MKNNKKYSAYVEWAIAVIILVICFNIVLSNRSFSPIKAHEKLEKTQHFGPSKIVNTLGVRDGEIYLCRYKDWFAAQLFEKNLFMWQPRAGEMGIQIDFSKDITYNWYAARIKDNPMTVNLYGYVNDPQISKIILEGESNKNTLSYDLDENRLFIFSWEEDERNNEVEYLKGVDNKEKVIYEEKIIGIWRGTN